MGQRRERLDRRMKRQGETRVRNRKQKAKARVRRAARHAAKAERLKAKQ